MLSFTYSTYLAMKNNSKWYLYIILLFVSMMTSSFNDTFAQTQSQYIRIAKIIIDARQLEPYKAALSEHAKAAVSNEAGVLTLYAVYEKNKPTHVTVFEIYASVDAYNFHIQTPHFLKYKAAVKNMVKSLTLTDVIPIALETKVLTQQ